MNAKNLNRRLAVMVSAISLQTALLWPLESAAQGSTFTFNNRIPGVLDAPIFGPEPSDPTDCRSGNTPTGLPPGIQSYGGERLLGTNYYAELWVGPLGTPEESFVPATPTTTFQTSPALAGYVVPVTITPPAFAVPGQTIQLQVRVWDNRGGASWAEALPHGKSAIWTVVVPNLTPVPPPTWAMAGLRSFNLCQPAQRTAFTYEGHLSLAGGAVNGFYDFQFSLYDALTGGHQLGPVNARLSVPVVNGVFRVTLDFGALFDGSPRWLEIALRDAAVVPPMRFITLSPRQEVTPSPQATFAPFAGTASLAEGLVAGTVFPSNLVNGAVTPTAIAVGAVTATAIANGAVVSGKIGSSAVGSVNLADNSVTTEKIADGTIGVADIGTGQVVKSLNGLRDHVTLQAGANVTITPSGQTLMIASAGGSSGWNLTGNSGTTPGVNFLGTTDNQPLELKVNASRALRLEPNSSLAPNFIAGSPVNRVGPGVLGSTIGGGGATNVAGTPVPISAHGDIGLWAEGNDYVFLTFSAESSIRLVSAVWDFTGSAVYVEGDGLLVDQTHGVTSWTFSPAIGAKRFTATFVGFDSGDDVKLCLDVRAGSRDAPLGSEYVGTLTLNFSDGTTLTAPFQELAAFAARASFATQSVLAYGNRVDSSYGVIGGGWGNTIQSNSVSSTLGGGYSNLIASNVNDGTIAGGSYNTNKTTYATIGGGTANTILTYAFSATIGGGGRNRIEEGANDTVIAGGYGNAIRTNSSFAAIGGGQLNVIEAASYEAAIGGGIANRIGSDGWQATIAGGRSNKVSLAYGTVGGGWGNQALNYSGTVGGGYQNTASGQDSSVPGGNNNTAAGGYSLAAGRRAKANHNGSLVWADSQDADFASTAINQANFRCGGGVRFTSGSGAANQTVSWAPGAASWSFSSDRNLKDELKPVNGREVLAKVARLPISEWNYQGYAQRHIGPMAQDFHAQFPLSDSETTLNSADLDGVALAAIQGLHQVVKEKEAEITELKHSVAELKALMKAMEEKVNGGGR
jgi:hypothetical protein